MSFDFEQAHRRREQIKNNIEKSYNGNLTPLTDEELEKAANDFFEKGGKRAVIGEKRMFGGREYIKTAQGWKFHGKGGGKKAKQHQEDTLEHHRKAGTKHPHEESGEGGEKGGLEGAKKSVSDALVSRFTNSEDEGAHEKAEKAIKDYMKASGINPVHIDDEPIMEDEMFYNEDGDMSPKQAQSHVKNKVLPYLDRVIQAMKDDGLGMDERKETSAGQDKKTDFLVDFFGEDQIKEYKKGGWKKENRSELVDNIFEALHDDTNDMDEPDYFNDDESGAARPSSKDLERAAEKIADKILEGGEKKEKASKKKSEEKDESWKGTNVRDMSAKQLRAAADHFGISTEGMKLKDVRAAVLDKTVDSHLEGLKKKIETEKKDKLDSKTQSLVDHYDKWIESYVSSGWGTDEKSKKLLESNIKKFLKKDVEKMNDSKAGKTQISSSDINKAAKVIADKIINKTIERYGERKHDWADTEEGKVEANKQQLEYSFYELLNDENNREASNDLYTSVAKVLQDNGVRLFYSFDFAKDMMDHDPAFKVGKGESRDDIYKHVRKEIIPRIEEMAGFAKEFEESLPQNYEDRYIPSINSYIHEEDERKKARKQQDKIMKDAFGISGKGDFRDSKEFKEIDKNWDGKDASELKKIFEDKVNSVTKNKKYNELAVKDAVQVMMRDIVDRRSNQIKKDFFKKHPHKNFNSK